MTDARKAGHTKGPWEVVFYGGGDSLVIHSDAENRVCFMATPGERGSLKTIMANARLIAAAPDLLDNEQKNLATLEWTRSRLIEWGKSTSEIDTAIDQTRAAIAKAN